MKGFNGQRDLLKWNNLRGWRQSLEPVACHCTTTLLLVSLTAPERHAVGAAIERRIWVLLFQAIFFLHTFARCVFTCCASETCMVRWSTTGKDARKVCFFRRQAVHWPICISEQALYTPDYTNQPALFLYTHVLRRPRPPVSSAVTDQAVVSFLRSGRN